MSRVGKKPVVIPSGVKIEMENNLITVTGPNGTLKQKTHPAIKIIMQGDKLLLSCASSGKFYKAIHGTTRTIIANMIKGVNVGFEKILRIEGVGYRASVSEKKLILQLGFSHVIEFPIPEGVNITVNPKQGQISVAGINKQIVGEIASNIRALKKPEPYKGKGIRYLGEHIKRKAGKAAGVGSGVGAKK